MNIYDEKRRNSVDAYCTAQRLTTIERCIQLEDARDARDAEIEKLKRERDEAREDTARLDWLEGEHDRETGPLDDDYERSLFRRNEPITRATIDAARERRGGAMKPGESETPDIGRLPPDYRREPIRWDGGRITLEKVGRKSGTFKGTKFVAWIESDPGPSGRRASVWSCAVQVGDVYLRKFGLGGGIRAGRLGLTELVKIAVWVAHTKR